MAYSNRTLNGLWKEGEYPNTDKKSSGYTCKKRVQTRHQSGLDVLKVSCPSILLSYSKSVVSIVLIIALIRLSSKIMILKIEGKAYRTATLDGQFILSVLNLPHWNIGEISYHQLIIVWVLFYCWSAWSTSRSGFPSRYSLSKWSLLELFAKNYLEVKSTLLIKCCRMFWMSILLPILFTRIWKITSRWR